MEISVLFEDDQLLLINKPTGIVVNRAESVSGETVQDWVENNVKYQVPNAKSKDLEDFISRSGIVHRIDKETTGILLIAKTPQAFAALQKQFKERTIKKTYLAIAHGAIAPSEGEIRAPVGRLPWNRLRFGVVPEGRASVTRYTVLRTFPSPKKKETLSLASVCPVTGRTHQIRVHFAYLAHPLLGDNVYAGRKVSRDDRIWVGRTMLHAWKIVFTHPVDGSILAFESPIPDDMKRISDAFESLSISSVHS